jgi:hypothetical protein
LFYDIKNMIVVWIVTTTVLFIFMGDGLIKTDGFRSIIATTRKQQKSIASPVVSIPVVLLLGQQQQQQQQQEYESKAIIRTKPQRPRPLQCSATFVMKIHHRITTTGWNILFPFRLSRTKIKGTIYDDDPDMIQTDTKTAKNIINEATLRSVTFSNLPKDQGK